MTRRLWWTLAVLTVYLLALGVFTALALHHDRIETRRRCDGVVAVIEEIGAEARAERPVIDRVIGRFQARTDC